MTDAAAPTAAAPTAAVATPLDPDGNAGLVVGAAVAVVVGAALVLTAHFGALPLLVAAAALQAVLAFAWVFGSGIPGRLGGVVIAALAAAGADVAMSVWPQGRLGVELAVLAVAVPVMFAHQLARGATRVEVVSSLSAIALLVLAEASLPALLQLRHEFGGGADSGGRVSAAAAGAITAALLTGYLLDLVAPVPRFDAAVPRGLLALVGSAGVGAAVGSLLLRDVHAFADGRAVFVGAGLGALAGLLSVAASFVLHSANRPASALGARLRPVVGTLLPVSVLAPVAFLLCLSVRA
ncbi:hypothetical protein [uncultured Jatrophihabitans sp.]|uniref:hypothetical protein n=1 Tax=uncultured Jatrophihabitans sp. TaxID=1610747 RepID=UPI0035CA6DDB